MFNTTCTVCKPVSPFFQMDVTLQLPYWSELLDEQYIYQSQANLSNTDLCAVRHVAFLLDKNVNYALLNTEKFE